MLRRETQVCQRESDGKLRGRTGSGGERAVCLWDQRSGADRAADHSGAQVRQVGRLNLKIARHRSLLLDGTQVKFLSFVLPLLPALSLMSSTNLHPGLNATAIFALAESQLEPGQNVFSAVAGYLLANFSTDPPRGLYPQLYLLSALLGV